ncbi:MAG: NUDIX domain-containing protein [Jatrophihabitantaceae bacterium]
MIGSVASRRRRPMSGWPDDVVRLCPLMSHSALHAEVRDLIAGLTPVDPLEAAHRRRTLSWMDNTDDVFRRTQPRTPSPHLVSYFLLVDHDAGSLLLVDHIRAGLWLPSGGHVEPGEHPVLTVRRELREELGISAEFSPLTGERPMFLSVTETARPIDKHTDVSLWFILCGKVGQPLTPDPREFRGVRWWTRAEVDEADQAQFDPHLGRMLTKFDNARMTVG